jgi:predicted RNA-binding Zn-ribbon protein involved in translation (DUF1610 family)
VSVIPDGGAASAKVFGLAVGVRRVGFRSVGHLVGGMRFECPDCGAVRRLPLGVPPLKRTNTPASSCPGCGGKMDFRA